MIAITLPYFYLRLLSVGSVYGWMIFFIIPFYVIGIILLFSIGLIKDISNNNKNKDELKNQSDIDIKPENKSYMIALKICKIFSFLNILMGSFTLGSCIIGMFASGSKNLFGVVLMSLVFFVITIVSYLGLKKQKIYGAICGIISYLFNFHIFFYVNLLLYIVLLIINIISSFVVIVYLHKTKK